MAVTSCENCGERVNVTAAVCPHCNAKRSTATMADAKLSKDEVRALLVTGMPEREDDRGLLATMFLPHDQTHGRARTIEIALTVLVAPFVIVGVLSYAMTFRRRRARRQAMNAVRGEALSALVMSGFGGLGFYSVVQLFGGPPVALTAISIVALWVRAGIRMDAASVRSRELTQLEKPDKPDKPQKPANQAKPERAARPSAPPAPEPPRSEPVQPGEEPRILR